MVVVALMTALSALASATNMATSPARSPQSERERSERALGDRLAKDVEKNARVITDPRLNAYLAEIAHKLTESSGTAVSVTIKVLADDEINAFSLPGGRVYVNSGMVLAAANEAQLATVLAHELAHVEAHDAARNAAKEKVLDVGLAPASVLPGPLGFALQKLRTVGWRHISRSSERRADRCGMQYALAAGYDPRELWVLLHNLEQEHAGSGCASAFSSCQERLTGVQEDLQRLRRGASTRDVEAVDTDAFEEARQRLRQLMQADSTGALQHPR